MKESLYEKNGNAIYILNVLKKYSDEEHMLKVVEIQRKIKEIYDVDIDPRTIKRIIHLLKEKLGYDISTRAENGKGYYISKNPETDFEPGEIRAIIDNFSYANYIVPSIAKDIIKKCKNLQNVYENHKMKDYKVYSVDSKTANMEVIKNIEDIQFAIREFRKITFEYWKYSLENGLKERIVSTPIVSPYAIVYKKQQFYMIGIKNDLQEFYHFRLDRMRNTKVLDENITIRKSKKEIQEFAESTVEMFGGKKDKIKIKCSKDLIDAVIDIFGKQVELEKIDDENFYMKTEANPLGVKMWAMRNIDMVEVIEPKYLREEMKEVVKGAIKKYGK